MKNINIEMIFHNFSQLKYTFYISTITNINIETTFHNFSRLNSISDISFVRIFTYSHYFYLPSTSYTHPSNNSSISKRTNLKFPATSHQ